MDCRVNRRRGVRRSGIGAVAAAVLLAAMTSVQGVQAQAPAAPETPRPPPYVPPADGPVEADGYYEIIEAVAPGIWVIRQAKPFHLQPIGNVTVIEDRKSVV